MLGSYIDYILVLSVICKNNHLDVKLKIQIFVSSKQIVRTVKRAAVTNPFKA